MDNTSRSRRQYTDKHSVDENVARYYRDVSQMEVLDAETERKLFYQYQQQNNLAARDRIIGNCLRFVVKLARRYTRNVDILKDLISAGNEGLLFALDRYDPDRNTRFLSYATYYALLYIRNEVHNTGLVAMPLWRTKTIRKVKQARHRNLPPPNEDEITKICIDVDITPSQLDKLRIEKFRYAPVDRACSSPGRDESRAINRQAIDALHKLLLGLGTKEQFVLRSYYGLVTDPMSLKQIATVLGVSSERVRQIKVDALQRLRRCLDKELNIERIGDLMIEVY